MPSQPRETCACCGAPMVEYRHRLSAPLAAALARAWQTYGPAPFNPANLGLNHNQMANWQKLRYFALIGKQPEDGDGTWRVTQGGQDFLRGIAWPATCYTYRGERTKTQPAKLEFVTIDQLAPGYEHRDWYIENRRPAVDERQQTLF